ncbi:MAG TPA: alginate lyase family protein [Anaerolineales bacterium]
MGLIHRLTLALKALHELGPQQVGLYAWYQFALRSGYLRLRTPVVGSFPSPQAGAEVEMGAASQPPPAVLLFPLPTRENLAALLGEAGRAGLLAEADEIASGQVRLFGGPPVALKLAPPGLLRHWTAAELRTESNALPVFSAEAASQMGEFPDIKYIWEPARFSWAFTLGRAYRLSGDERYPDAFWRCAETFLQANPPNLGLNWVSAQEVALRLIAFAFARQVFSASPHTTPQRAARLELAIAAHAARIPPTLAYARAQNNNHLLTEAAGLYTAGLLLPGHPAAARWRGLGWRWFNRGLQTQIAADGAYVQQSANYHRLMLQAALWVAQLAGSRDQALPEATRQKLAQATRWLLALLDPVTGRVPNLGPNDGAYILPLSTGPFFDYRPVLQAAAQAFLGARPFEPGIWDEMPLWLNGEGPGPEERAEQPDLQHLTSDAEAQIVRPASPHVLRSPSGESWAYLRLAHFTARPGHADQLHLDLWWRGLNVAQDAGAFLYNTPAPWDNALARTAVHNTVSLNGRDQMNRAGRFLFLDWAQARVVSYQRAEDGAWERLLGEHDGYRRLGAIHQRAVERRAHRWRITDTLLKIEGPRLRDSTASEDLQSYTCDLHWLLPDWPFDLQEMEDQGPMIILHSPLGQVTLGFRPGPDIVPLSQISKIQIARAGKLLHGEGPASPTAGWASPTYGCKVPALSVDIISAGPLPVSLVTEFTFPES